MLLRPLDKSDGAVDTCQVPMMWTLRNLKLYCSPVDVDQGTFHAMLSEVNNQLLCFVERLFSWQHNASSLTSFQ